MESFDTHHDRHLLAAGHESNQNLYKDLRNIAKCLPIPNKIPITWSVSAGLPEDMFQSSPDNFRTQAWIDAVWLLVLLGPEAVLYSARVVILL